jgi:hypothetical protein
MPKKDMAADTLVELPKNSFALSNAGVSRAKTRRAGIRRRLFEFFNSGLGRWIAAPVIDVHFRLWKLRHGVATFGEYYGRSIALELKRGGTHKTLGNKTFLSGWPFAAPKNLAAAEFGARGFHYFVAAVKAGLKPHHV